MKKGLFVLANLALLLFIGVPAFSQPSDRGVETVMIDNFDDPEAVEWTWNVQASRFVADGYPLLSTFEAIPNTLRVIKRSDDVTPKVLGVKVKFNRKGDNWFEVYPTKDDKPYEYEFNGTVTQLDFWVWGAHYNYFLDVLVRDADGRVHIIPVGNLAFDGWKNFIVNVPHYIRQHSRLRSGPKNLTFIGFRVTSDPDEFVDEFMVYFDHFKYTTNALINVFDGYDLQNADFGDSESSAAKDGE